MLHLLQMGSFKMLTALFLQIQNSWQLSLLKLPPCWVPARNIVTSSSESPGLYTSTLQSGLLSANAALPPHPRLQTSYSPLPILYLLPLLPYYRLLLPAALLRLLLPLLPLTPSRFFNEMLAVSEPVALNRYTFFRPIPFTLSASRNPILTHLPLSGCLDSLLCNLIAPTPGWAFSLVMPRTLAAGSSYSSGRTYPSLNFLSSLFFRLAPTLNT